MKTYRIEQENKTHVWGFKVYIYILYYINIEYIYIFYYDIYYKCVRIINKSYEKGVCVNTTLCLELKKEPKESEIKEMRDETNNRVEPTKRETRTCTYFVVSNPGSRMKDSPGLPYLSRRIIELFQSRDIGYIILSLSLFGGEERLVGTPETPNPTLHRSPYFTVQLRYP